MIRRELGQLSTKRKGRADRTAPRCDGNDPPREKHVLKNKHLILLTVNA